MKLSTKILIWAGVVVCVSFLFVMAYKQFELSSKQTAIQDSVVGQKRLVDEIVRGQSRYATKKDMEVFAKNNQVNLEKIQDDLAKLNAVLSAINVSAAHSKGSHNSNIPSTGTGGSNPEPTTGDPHGYMKTEQKLSIAEDFGREKVPFGEVGFSSWKEKPWSLKVHSRQYNLTNVVGIDENKRHYIYNKFSIDVDGKTYNIPITKSETRQERPSATFHWFNPRLFVGMDSGLNAHQVQAEFTPSFGVGLMSYGQYKSQPDLSLIQLGVGYGIVSKKPQAIITPAAYNIGKHIPLLNNLYVAPSVQLGINGDVTGSAGIRVGL